MCPPQLLLLELFLLHPLLNLRQREPQWMLLVLLLHPFLFMHLHSLNNTRMTKTTIRNLLALFQSVLCHHLLLAHQLLCLSNMDMRMKARTTCTAHHLLVHPWTAHLRHHLSIKTVLYLCLLLNHRHLLARPHINLGNLLMSAVRQ
jgi:hypothetical protein